MVGVGVTGREFPATGSDLAVAATQAGSSCRGSRSESPSPGPRTWPRPASASVPTISVRVTARGSSSTRAADRRRSPTALGSRSRGSEPLLGQEPLVQTGGDSTTPTIGAWRPAGSQPRPKDMRARRYDRRRGRARPRRSPIALARASSMPLRRLEVVGRRVATRAGPVRRGDRRRQRRSQGMSARPLVVGEPRPRASALALAPARARVALPWSPDAVGRRALSRARALEVESQRRVGRRVDLALGRATAGDEASARGHSVEVVTT